MNKIKYIIGLLAVFAVISANAAVEDFVVFSTGGTAVNLGTNYVIIPSQSRSGGAPVIKGLTCRVSITGGATLQAFYSTNQTTIVATNVIGLERTNFVGSTNGFTGGQALVVYHARNTPRTAYEYLLVSTTQNTNQLVFASAPVTPIQVGDTINGETVGASIAIVSSVTANTAFTTPIFSGQQKEPLLVTLQQVGSASATNTIDSIYAEFPTQ